MIDRKITTGLYLRRALSCGLSIADLEALSVGMVNDVFIEAGNDSHEYAYVATQEDMDRL